jgi:hypothetical protein
MKLFSEYLAEAEAAEQSHKDGTYASLSVKKIGRDKLHSWLEKQKIEGLVDPKEYHCTIVFSTKPVPEVKDIPVPFPIKAKAIGWDIFGSDKMLVLKITNPKLFDLFDKTVEMGAVSDYPSFVPHISVATGYKGDIPTKIPSFLIQFDKFKVGPLDRDFEYNDDE